MNQRIIEIKTYLRKNKITYKTISEKTGISEGTLKNIFSGLTKNPRIDTIQAIENAAGINKSNAEKIKKNLKDLNLTYEEFSDISNVSVNTLKNIFSGRTQNPRYSTEIAILNTLKELNKKNDSNYDIKKEIPEENLTISSMYQDLSPNNQDIILKIAYILLSPEKREKYEILSKFI